MIDRADTKHFMLQNKVFELLEICKIRHWEQRLMTFSLNIL